MAEGMVAIMYAITISLVVFLSRVSGKSSYYDQQAVIAVKVENGQVYDCVDFYKQPAFSHPLLKNLSSKVISRSILIQGEKLSDFGLKDGGCPYKTVPILRTSVHDIEPPPPPPPPEPEKHCISVVRTTDTDKKFLGAAAYIALYKPEVYNDQWSTARVKLVNGEDSIEAGWMVNPDLFKDKEAHLYVKFTAGQSGCVNTQCPGFVQVDRRVPLGFIPKNYSISHGLKYYWNTIIKKDGDNWWVLVGKDQVKVGYWPNSIFSSLKDVATQAEWGGEIDNPKLTSPVPMMGNGWKAAYNTEISAFMRRVTVIGDGSGSSEPQNTKKYWDCPSFYTVLDMGNKGDFWGRIIFYGGGQPTNRLP